VSARRAAAADPNPCPVRGAGERWGDCQLERDRFGLRWTGVD
jgi:hypothetical protein